MRGKTKAKEVKAIVGTNDYSIVSKGSVERLYYPADPAFYGAFVPKYTRRAPLVNRGYWLRMRVIETAIKQFLDEPSHKPKLICNLGAGFEPLPFRMLWKYPHKCAEAGFVDVDFPQLIQRKADIMSTDPIFSQYQLDLDLLLDSDGKIFDYGRYTAIACDLGAISELSYLLKDKLRLEDHSVLFVAENSIVYMSPDEGTNLIELCSTFPHARFCMLEQHLPAGPKHPFARTMLDYFSKQVSLRGMPLYSTMQSQEVRFRTKGWLLVDTVDLWSLWQDEGFLPHSEKQRLDGVESFDEFEELAMFGGHHFVLIATTRSQSFLPFWNDRKPVQNVANPQNGVTRMLQMTVVPGFDDVGRKDGAIAHVSSSYAMHCGGTARNRRQGGTDLYTSTVSTRLPTVSEIPEPSTHHTITAMGPGLGLMVGGRTSPSRARRECWLFNSNTWSKSPALPAGRYRHSACAVAVGNQPGIVLYGGRASDGRILNDWLLFINKRWHVLKATGDLPPPLFAAAAASTSSNTGILAGGLSSNHCLLPKYEDPCLWIWELRIEEDSPTVHVTYVRVKQPDSSLARSVNRFGAAAVVADGHMFLIGGAGELGPLQKDHEIIRLGTDGSVSRCTVGGDDCKSLPSLVGHSVFSTSDNEVVVLGGGMVCFAWGAYWNTNIYTIRSDMQTPHTTSSWAMAATSYSLDKQGMTLPSSRYGDKQQERSPGSDHSGIRGAQVERISATSSMMSSITRYTALPFVLTELYLGSCAQAWSAEYLKTEIGPEKPTVIHKATSAHLSFHVKNFTYETVPFASFIDAAASGVHVYLRALSAAKPSKLAANLAADYPSIASDFIIPPELSFASSHQHSSVLRISGNVNMWLHYDVMSNVLCQVSGSKRIILFRPKDVSHLGFPPGETTSSVDVFTGNPGQLAACSPVETTLSAGEVLFIPACWPHATAPARSVPPSETNLSVAVNLFFRSLDDKFYAAGRDVYGNRDLEMCQNGRKHVSRILGLLKGAENEEQKLRNHAANLRAMRHADVRVMGTKEASRIITSAKELPTDIAQFYLTRLADELINSSVDAV